MARGRESTVKKHPRLEEIEQKIRSGGVSYREIAEEYGLSLSSIKRFAAELKSEPENIELSNRSIVGHPPGSLSNREAAHQRQVFEAADDRQGAQDEKLDQHQNLLSKKKAYKARRVPVLRLCSDLDFEPGIQSQERYASTLAELRIEEDRKAEKVEVDPFDYL